MMRGQQKCLVMVTNKNGEEIIVAPDFFKQSFKDIGVQTGAQIVLHEFRNMQLDADEEGEEENEEMEEEQVEENPEAEQKP